MFLNCIRCRGQMVRDWDGFTCAQCGYPFYIQSKMVRKPDPTLRYMIPSECGVLPPAVIMFVPRQRGDMDAVVLETQALCVDCKQVSMKQRMSRKHRASSDALWHFTCPSEHRFKVEVREEEMVAWRR